MTKEEKYALVQEQQTSGLSHAAFCASKSISLQTFRQWKYSKSLRGSENSKAPRFVELIQKQTHDPIIVSVGRFRLEIPYDFDCKHLSRILESLPC